VCVTCSADPRCRFLRSDGAIIEAGKLGGTTMKATRANAVDAAVGARIRNLRLRNKLSQTDLGRQVGVTFQQIQKYEKGTNRVSAGRLAELAKFFDLPVTAFYSEVAERGAKSPSRTNAGARPADANVDRLVRAFQALKDNSLKAAILRVVEEMVLRRPKTGRGSR